MLEEDSFERDRLGAAASVVSAEGRSRLDVQQAVGSSERELEIYRKGLGWSLLIFVHVFLNLVDCISDLVNHEFFNISLTMKHPP